MALETHDILISCWRWLAGLGLGATTGLVVAMVVRGPPAIRNPSLHTAGFFRALPILALVPVVSRTIGVGELAKILLIAWACFFPVLIATITSVSREIVDLELRIDVAGLSRMAKFHHYEFPRTFFGFLTGVEISLGIGWLTVVAAEYLLGSWGTGPFRGGLGNAVFQAFNNNDKKTGLLCIAIFGVLGVASSLIWKAVSRRSVKALGFDPSAIQAR